MYPGGKICRVSGSLRLSLPGGRKCTFPEERKYPFAVPKSANFSVWGALRELSK